MMVLEPEIDPNLCRLCGKADGLKVDIFDDKHSYQKKIHSLLPVAIYEYDPLPKKMCHRCMFQVDGFYEFRENCLKTEQYLKLQLPWMPHKANNGNTDESTLNKEPMVHISSPTLNAFTMDQWFAARNMMEADDDVQIIDVFCRPCQSNGRTATSEQPEERPVVTDGSRLDSRINDECDLKINEVRTTDWGQNIPTESSCDSTLLCVKGKTGKKQKRSEVEQPTELSAVSAMVQEYTAGSTNEHTMAINILVEKSTTGSATTMVGGTEKCVSNSTKKDEQQNVPVYTVHDEQENDLLCIVEHTGVLLDNEDQEQCKLGEGHHKEQEESKKAEEQSWEHLHQFQNGQKQNPIPTQAQKPFECDVEDGTRHTVSLITTSDTGDTAVLSERGIAHVRKQMEEQQKKSLLVSIGSRRASANREECPSGCRRRRPAAHQAGMSGCATPKLSKINRKPGGSLFSMQAKDTDLANKPDEGEGRVLPPKNVVKVTIPKILLTDGASDISQDIHNHISNSQENLDTDENNVNRRSKEVSKSPELKGEALENKTLEERSGIIVTRIPAACDIYTCETCERMFVTRETAYSHMCDEGGEGSSIETETGGQIRFRTERSAGDCEQYSCYVCGQRFSRNATLAAHLKSHTKVWSDSDDSDGLDILRDISTDSDDTESRGKGSRRRRRRSRKSSTYPRKSVKLSLPVVV